MYVKLFLNSKRCMWNAAIAIVHPYNPTYNRYMLDEHDAVYRKSGSALPGTP